MSSIKDLYYVGLAYTQRQLFEAWAVPCIPELRAHAKRLCANNDQAQDLVQQSLIKAMRAWPSFVPVGDPTRSVRAWLARIVTNELINGYHHTKFVTRQCEGRRDEILVATYGTEVDGYSQEHDDGIGGISDQVLAALQQLEPRQRELVVRCDIRNEKYADIAKAMHIPIGTVMSGLHRARKRLAVELAAYARDEYGIERTVALAEPPRLTPELADGSVVLAMCAPDDELDDDDIVPPPMCKLDDEFDVETHVIA